MLSLNNVAIRRGSDVLFSEASLTIHRRYRVGLIGANGSGKSSLFEAILSRLDTDQGSIELPTNTTIAHMAQEVPGTSEPALDYVLKGDRRYSDVIEKLKLAETSERFDQIAELHETLDSIDGYTAPARAERMMAGLGFSQDEMKNPLSAFSGGWRIRLNLAQTLMCPADLMLLDEPTNHLDLDAILWLANWIRQYTGTLLLISHDREFLDECVDHIAYLHAGKLELFTGNYSGFEIIKASRLALQQASFEKQQREVEHMQDFVRRFRAKASKARQAQSRIKALERMELIAPAHIDSPFEFTINAQEKVSSPLLTLEDASLGYDREILSNVNLSILPGDRLGLLGVNGAGKSTLIKTLLGTLSLLGGERVEGSNLATAYFSQHQLDELHLEQTALDHLFELGRTLGAVPTEQVARNFMGGFNFHGDKVLEPVDTFSGGEKARLALSLITYTRPNLLLMDEPTNHLDIDMRQALTVALQSFIGALVMVSHDRHLIQNTVDEFILIEDGGVSTYQGDMQDYARRSETLRTAPEEVIEETRQETRGDVSDTALPNGKSETWTEKKSGARPGKLLRQLKTRIKTLESQLERLQNKLGEVETSLNDPGMFQDHENPKLQVLLTDQLALTEQIDALENEWLELQQEAESFA